MAIITKLLLDHVTFQFSYGGEHQKAQPGELEGAHFTEVEYFVDDASGSVIGRTANALNGAAQPLDAAKVGDLLGEKFTAFEKQLRDTQQQLAAALSDISEREAKITSLKEQLANRTEEHGAMVKRNAAAQAALAG